MFHEPVSEYSSSNADLVYAVNETGRIVHISDVNSGLGCNCRCPACDMRVIAKKGSKVTHYFSHKADSSCRAAAETALHRLAKEIIERELKLWLPAVIAPYGKEVHQLYSAGYVSFTRVQSEARHFHEIVPDLFVERGDRKLLVEIWVTHPCDEAKLHELRQKGIATLEIDLSNFPRNASREEVTKAVLEQAHRRWVYHPMIDAEIATMRAADEAAKRLEKETFEKRVEKAAAEYRQGLKDIAARGTVRFSRKSDIFRVGYGPYIGIAVGGEGCFTVSTKEWQFYILCEAFAPRQDGADPVYRVKNLFDWFKKRKFIRSAFNYVKPDIEEALIARGIGFLTPYRCIETYLEELRDRGVLLKQQAFYSAPGLVEAINKLRDADLRRERNRESLIERGEKVLQALPESERLGLTGESWLNMPQRNGVSLAEALDRDHQSINTAFFFLRDIEAMIFNKGRIVEETLGLPIKAECARQRFALQEEVAAREAARLKALCDAEEMRVQHLKNIAREHLQTDSEVWLTTVNRELGDKVPLGMARAGDRELDLALTILHREIRRRCEAEKQRQSVLDLRSELEREVTAILGPAGRFFLISPYPELGRKKPIDYCVSPQTKKACLELAEKVRRSRR